MTATVQPPREVLLRGRASSRWASRRRGVMGWSIKHLRIYHIAGNEYRYLDGKLVSINDEPVFDWDNVLTPGEIAAAYAALNELDDEPVAGE